MNTHLLTTDVQWPPQASELSASNPDPPKKNLLACGRACAGRFLAALASPSWSKNVGPHFDGL